MEKEKFLEPLYEILNKDCVEKLRVLDPRVHHYSLYVEVTDADAEKIVKAYENVKVQYSLFKKIKTISKIGIEGFTIYNVTGKKRDNLIKKHDEEHKKALEKVEREGILF